MIDGELYTDDLIQVAGKHGFASEDTELSDFELEMVSGGFCGRSSGNKEPKKPADDEDDGSPLEPQQVTGTYLKGKTRISFPKIKLRW